MNTCTLYLSHLKFPYKIPIDLKVTFSTIARMIYLLTTDRQTVNYLDCSLKEQSFLLEEEIFALCKWGRNVVTAI